MLSDTQNRIGIDSSKVENDAPFGIGGVAGENGAAWGVALFKTTKPTVGRGGDQIDDDAWLERVANCVVAVESIVDKDDGRERVWIDSGCLDNRRSLAFHGSLGFDVSFRHRFASWTAIDSLASTCIVFSKVGRNSGFASRADWAQVASKEFVGGRWLVGVRSSER